MKAILLLCLFVAGARASCDNPGSTFENLGCSFMDTLSNLGNSLLDSLQDVAINAATTLTGQLISGFQDIADVAAGTPAPAVGKRSMDIATVMRAAKFLQTHRQMVEDVGNLVRNVSNVSMTKLQGILAEFERNPSEELAMKALSYISAHHLIQEQLLKAIQQYVPPTVILAAQDLLTSHKRQTVDLLSQVQQVGNQLATSFGPLVSTLQGLLGGLGNQLLSFFETLLPSADQLIQAFQPHLPALAQHGNNLLDTASGAVSSIGDAVGDVLQETLTQSAPSVSGLLTHAGQALSTYLQAAGQ